MVDFQNGAGSEPGFSVGNKSTKKSGLRARDIISLLSVIVSLLLVIACIYYIDKEVDREHFINSQKPEDEVLQKMGAPDLDKAPALPSAEDLSIWDDHVEWVMKNPKELVNQFNGYSHMSFAWLRKQNQLDLKEAPLSQYFNIEDIIVDGLAFGTPTIIEGNLINAKTVSAEGIGDWQWITIEAEPHQFVMLLAPASLNEYTIGNKVAVVGRSMGLMKSPGNTGEWMTLIGTRNIIERKENKKIEVPGVLPAAPELGKSDEEEQKLFSYINDERTVLELRPYFYLVGKIKKIDSYDENVYEKALSINKIAGMVHDKPSDYRGKIFSIEGRVLDVFMDDSVAELKPYDIDKVSRVIVWALVREMYQTKDITGKVTERIETVRHTFELAVVGDIPKLKQGQLIRSRGRFLKVHGIPMDRSSNRDAVFGRLQSDNFYSKLFIVPSITVVEEEKDSIWVKVALTVVMCSFFVCVLWLYFKDIRQNEKYRTRPRHRHSKPGKEKTDSTEGATSE